MTDAPKWRKSSLFPKQLGAHVEPLTRPVLKAQGLAGSRILTEWAQIVGPQLASHCMPEKLNFPAGKKTGGTLVIAAESGYATQLQHMQPVLLERLAGYFGYKAIARITIAHTYQTPVAAPKPPPPKPTLNAESVALAASVEDPQLRETLESFARALTAKEGEKR